MVAVGGKEKGCKRLIACVCVKVLQSMHNSIEGQCPPIA